MSNRADLLFFWAVKNNYRLNKNRAQFVRELIGRIKKLKSSD